MIFWIGGDMNMYYIVNLRETQRTSKLNINSLKIYEKVPKHSWRIAIVKQVLPSADSENKRNNKDQCNPQTSRK